ncbi:hypothetical protein [Rickettsia bellii]|nr:hypothetical protein [Rickettsia bellii]
MVSQISGESVQAVDKLREQRRIPKFGLPNLEVLKVYQINN